MLLITEPIFTLEVFASGHKASPADRPYSRLRLAKITSHF
jgi:hypothetical protein